MFSRKNSSEESSHNRSISPKTSEGHNIITSSTDVEGNVKAKGDFRIDGIFRGNLNCDAKVIIGEGGSIEGDVFCENAVIEGKFNGNLKVNDVLYVKESAVIHGEVVTGKLVVQAGSIFEVNCKMTGNIGVEEVKLLDAEIIK